VTWVSVCQRGGRVTAPHHSRLQSLPSPCYAVCMPSHSFENVPSTAACNVRLLSSHAWEAQQRTEYYHCAELVKQHASDLCVAWRLLLSDSDTLTACEAHNSKSEPKEQTRTAAAQAPCGGSGARRPAWQLLRRRPRRSPDAPRPLAPTAAAARRRRRRWGRAPAAAPADCPAAPAPPPAPTPALAAHRRRLLPAGRLLRHHWLGAAARPAVFDGREHGCRRALVMSKRAGRMSPQVWQHTASVQARPPSLARVRGGRHQVRLGRATPSPLLPCAAPAARSAPTPAALLQPACSNTGRSWLPAGPPRSRSRCALEAAVPVAQMPASQPVQTSAARDQGPQAARPSCAAARPAGEALRAPQTLAHTSTSGEPTDRLHTAPRPAAAEPYGLLAVPNGGLNGTQGRASGRDRRLDSQKEVAPPARQGCDEAPFSRLGKPEAPRPAGIATRRSVPAKLKRPRKKFPADPQRIEAGRRWPAGVAAACAVP